MPVTVYKSTDASAPVLTGQVGSLTTLLDAVLVNGYGAKASAGWTIPFTAASKRVYRPAAGSAQHYLRVDDAATVNTTSLGREALCRGFEAMTTVDAGTGPFPTTTQIANGICIRKSATNDATARAWVAVADGRTLYLFTKSGDWTGYSGFVFGDFFSLRAGDAFRSIIVGRAVNNVVIALDSDDTLQNLAALAAAATGHYIPRAWNADSVTGAPTLVGKHGSAVHSTAVLSGLAHYPNPVDGSLLLSQVWIHEDVGTLAAIRGRLRGFWHFLHPASSPVSDGDTFAGSGALAGKTFLIILPTPLGNAVYVMETSDTWEAN